MGNKSIGSFIAILRKAKGMTQQDLALKLNVSNKTVSKWECGETYPDISLIPIIAEIFEVTCDELLKGERILYEDKSEKTDIKITKQMRYLIDKTIVRFKLYSLINIMFIIIGGLVNYILSYSLYRPDIGFGVMVSIFVICIILEIIALINLNNKYSDREWFDESGIDFKNLKLIKYKYSFIVFYLSFVLIFLTLPLFLPRIFAKGDLLPVKSVLMLSEYIKLLPYFSIIPIISLLPAQSLYKTIFLKDYNLKVNKKIIIFDLIRLFLITCSFAIGYFNLYFITGNFTLNILPIFLFTALIIAGGTIFLLCSHRNIDKDEKINMLISSARNLIYLFCPLIETLYLDYFKANLAVFLNYSLIILTTTIYALIIRKSYIKL